MTRSVEIPEAAVEAAAMTMPPGGTWEILTKAERGAYRDAAYSAIAAALPYLAPAVDSFEVHAIQPHGDVIYQVRKITVDVVGEFPTYEQARDHAEVWQVNSNG